MIKLNPVGEYPTITKNRIKNKKYCNQLCILENTQENHDAIKQLNEEFKLQGSKWKLYKKYRKPKEGKKYGWGGSLAKEDALGIGLYIREHDTSLKEKDDWRAKRINQLMDEKHEIQNDFDKMVDVVNRLMDKQQEKYTLDMLIEKIFDMGYDVTITRKREV